MMHISDPDTCSCLGVGSGEGFLSSPSLLGEKAAVQEIVIGAVNALTIDMPDADGHLQVDDLPPG